MVVSVCDASSYLNARALSEYEGLMDNNNNSPT